MSTITAEIPLADLKHVSGLVEQRAARRTAAIEAGEAEIKVLVIANGKGGVGKSSLAAALGAAMARTGLKVLLIEMDPQGNNAEDLGTINTDRFDNGKAQAEAILNGLPMTPIGQARKNLYVVPGGEALEDIAEELYCQRRHGREIGSTTWMSMYAASIEQVEDDYDVVLLDVAPGSLVFQLEALVAGDAVIVPSKSDPSSRKGLRAVARRFSEASEHNDMLLLLGVVLFATNSSATRVRQQIRTHLEGDLRGHAPVFDQTIRHVEAAAVQARLRGLTPQELSKVADLDPALKKSADELAKDYRALAQEINEAIHQKLDELNAPEPDEADA
jgi:cellulose biosynthesis protein BcsQ